MKALAGFLGDRFPRVRAIIESEEKNQKELLNLIGSANKPFESVLESRTLPFHSNPGEGFPGKRYFPGCENIDAVEEYAEQLAKSLFQKSENYWFTAQPYSGTQANQIVYNAALRPGDKILCMDLASGGHVSHWSFTKRYFEVHSYRVEDGAIDYDELAITAKQIKPKLIVAGASSYPRKIDYVNLGKIAKSTGALLLADLSHTAAYIMSNIHISPFGHADFITMTTHKTTRGVRGGMMFTKREHEEKIKRAIFPISQGAPIFPDIIGKCIMLEELKSLDINAYASRAIEIAKHVASLLKHAGFNLYTDGTDTHLIIIDLSSLAITGHQAEIELEKNGILVNRNLIPNDPLPATEASGIRIGVLMMATCGFSDEDISKITAIIIKTLRGENNLIEQTKQILSKYKM